METSARQTDELVREFTHAVTEDGRAPVEVFTEIIDRELGTRHNPSRLPPAEDRGMPPPREDQKPACAHEPRAASCRVEQISVVVHGEPAPHETGRPWLEALAQAALDRLDATDPHWGLRQDLVRADRKARRCIPDGPICSERMPGTTGEEVRAELEAAVRAVVRFLTPAAGRRSHERGGPPTQNESGDESDRMS